MPHQRNRCAPRFFAFLAARAPLALVALLALCARPGRVLAQVTTPPDANTPTQPTISIPAAVPPPGRDQLVGRAIARVEVEGNSRTDTATILAQVRAAPGQPYDARLINVDVRSIASLERFLTVRADIVPTPGGQVVVRFVVAERNVVTAVEIFGNTHIRDEKIRPLLISHPNGPVDEFAVKTDVRTIQDMYVKLGYNFCHATIDEKMLHDQGIVRFTIVEGPKVRIRIIRFTGNQHLSGRGLRWKIKTHRYFFIIHTGRLNQDDLDQDNFTIRDKYVSKGYLDARVDHDLNYTPDKTRVEVRFIISEGPLYHIGKINIKGNQAFATHSLQSQLTVKPGDPMERARIDATRNRIADLYGHAGFIYARVEPGSTFSEQPAIADLNLNVTEGQSYDVGRVIVEGNAEIEDRVIRRQVRIYPEQVYDTVLVKKSIDRLKAAGIFQNVDIIPIGNEQNTRDALVRVSEGKTAKFLIGAGLSSNSGLLGQVSLEQNNFDIGNPPHSVGEFFSGQAFKGAGQFFRILLEPGTDVQRYRITFTEPYVLDSDYSFSNDAYFFTRSRESWDESRLGDLITLGRRFGDIYEATVGIRAENVRISNQQDFGIPLLTDTTRDSAQEILSATGDTLITSIRPAFVRDTTDSRLFPTSGTRLVAGVEQYGALGGNFTFTKITGTFDYFLTLYTDPFDRKTIFRSSSDFGIIPVGNSAFFERFYGGGTGSLRGFKFRGVSPRSGPLQDPIGGDFSVTQTFEVNHPLFEELLRGVAFIDIGDVERSVNFGTFRGDIGLGVRVQLPLFSQVPLALDFAYPFAKAPGDQTQFISFSLGLPF